MKITDKQRLDWFSHEGYEKVSKIEFDVLMPHCRCGQCYGVGIYRINDELFAFGETIREAIDAAIRKERESGNN